MLVQIRTQITESHSLHIVSPAPRSAERQDSPRQTSGSTDMHSTKKLSR